MIDAALSEWADGGRSNPGVAVEEAVGQCLELIETWLHWDGSPHLAEPGSRIYTPHKAVRRIANHLVDHLAETEALLAGVESRPDGWHGHDITLESDWARFTALDCDEAARQLPLLARTFTLRLAAAGREEWDRPRDPWTLREMAEHLQGVRRYADYVGDLSPQSLTEPRRGSGLT